MNPEKFQELLAQKGLILSEKQLQQFEKYYELLVTWNGKMNLTAITDKEEVYLKHFYDSISLAFSNDFSTATYSLCDVGSGAGFPSVPLKIAFPNIRITIVDSLNKRIHFLQALCEEIGLDVFELYHDRAEIFGQNPKFRESFDFVTARAVARLNVLTELCLPLVKKKGFFLGMKASKSTEEISEAQKAISLLGGKLVAETDVTLPISLDERHVISIQKVKETPRKYPRKAGTPNKQPIV